MTWIWSKEQLIFFHWCPSCIISVTHEGVHCHWRWQCKVWLLASFATWIYKRVIAKQCNGMAAAIGSSRARWSFSFRKFELLWLLVILRICWVSLTWINGCLGNYLAIVRQDLQDISFAVSFALNPSLSALRWNLRWICGKFWFFKESVQKTKKILPNDH